MFPQKLESVLMFYFTFWTLKSNYFKKNLLHIGVYRYNGVQQLKIVSWRDKFQLEIVLVQHSAQLYIRLAIKKQKEYPNDQ